MLPTFIASCFLLLAAPVLCRGGARYTSTIRDWHRTPPPVPSRPSPGAPGLGREGTGGVCRGTRCVARNALHPGTRPGQRQNALDTYIAFRDRKSGKNGSRESQREAGKFVAICREGIKPWSYRWKRFSRNARGGLYDEMALISKI